MITQAFGKFVAMGIVTLGFAAGLAAQSSAPDPWQRVPAAPTSCFAHDDYGAKLATATDTLSAEVTRQTELNAQIRKSFDEMDMMEKAQRMQAFMMKNPERAMKMLQAEQALGAQVGSDIDAVAESMKKLNSEMDHHKASLKDAVERAVAPVHAKQKQLLETRTRLVGEVQAAVFLTLADFQRYEALVQEENAAYEQVCAGFFGPTGVLTVWLKSYKTEVIERMHASDDAGEAAMVAQMAIMDTPTGGYRATEPHKAVFEYLRVAGDVYALRRAKAVASTDLKP